MNDRVAIDFDGHIAHVRMVHPESLNALDNAMFDALIEAGMRLKETPSVRCVVISGEGRAFCAGIDKGIVGKLSGGDASIPSLARGLAARTHGIANREQYAVMVWREVPVPVIAAVHGAAFGGGFQLMLGADMRYIAPETRLSIMEIKWGLVPDMAGTLLANEVGRPDVVRELTYTGRIFSGTEALAYGFATHVCDNPIQAAFTTARDIATKSPFAVRTAKQLYNELPTHDAAAALLAESTEQERVIAHPHHAEAVASNLENRNANFMD